MGNLVFVSSVVLITVCSVIATRSYLLTLVLLPVYVVVGYLVSTYLAYLKQVLIPDAHLPPVAGSILDLIINYKNLFDYLTTLARKYPTYRMITHTRNEVYTVDPLNIEHILKTNFSNYGKGEKITEMLRDLLGDGIFAVDGQKWRHQRKLASYEFSARVLRDYSSTVFRSCAAKLAMKIHGDAVVRRQMEFEELLTKSGMDSMFKVGFGVDLDALSGSNETNNQFIKAFDDSNAMVYWRYIDVFWKMKRFLNIGQERALKKNIKIIDNFVYKLINHKREQMRNKEAGTTKEDILSRFMLESEKDKENITDKYLRDISLSFLGAGKDTTGKTLTWFFYMLCKNPLVEQKVFLEVESATEVTGQLSVDEFVLKLTDPTLDKMHYLHSVLTETLRLYPAVPLDGKCSNGDDILPNGCKVKEGDGIAYVPYAMGRMTYIWGEDAEEFRPERWLENGVFKAESPFKFASFQAGPRICLGKEFAYTQMKIVAATLVFFFRFKLVDENKGANYRTMITLQMDGGLPVYAFPRDYWKHTQCL